MHPRGMLYQAGGILEAIRPGSDLVTPPPDELGQLGPTRSMHMAGVSPSHPGPAPPLPQLMGTRPFSPACEAGVPDGMYSNLRPSVANSGMSGLAAGGSDAPVAAAPLRQAFGSSLAEHIHVAAVRATMPTLMDHKAGRHSTFSPAQMGSTLGGPGAASPTPVVAGWDPLNTLGAGFPGSSPRVGSSQGSVEPAQ